jgi:hypothetical protein
MEKLGVEYDQEKVKEAEEGKNPNACPICGKDSGESRNCPDHGTEGFERKPEQEAHGMRSGRFKTTPNISNPPRSEADDMREFWNY